MKKTHPTKLQLIAEYKNLWKRLNKQPAIGDFVKHCDTRATVFRVFGVDGWKKLIAAAGGSPRPRTTRAGFTQEHLIDDFLKLQQELGRRPKLIEYTYQCHTPKVLDKAFGSPGWRNMLAILDYKVLHRGIDSEHLILDYLSLRKELGKNPRMEQFIKHCRHTYKLLNRIFGSRPWSKLLAESEKYEAEKQCRER